MHLRDSRSQTFLAISSLVPKENLEKNASCILRISGKEFSRSLEKLVF